MFLALISPVAVGTVAPGSADVIEPRTTVMCVCTVCMYRAWTSSPHGVSNGALKETRLSVTLICSRYRDHFNPVLTSAGGARPSACLYVELPSSHCFSAFHKARSDYSCRFHIASVWTNRNPIMSFIKLQYWIWMLYKSYVSHYPAVHPSPFLALKMVCLVSWSRVKSKYIHLLCVIAIPTSDAVWSSLCIMVHNDIYVKMLSYA